MLIVFVSTIKVDTSGIRLTWPDTLPVGDLLDYSRQLVKNWTANVAVTTPELQETPSLPTVPALRITS